MAETIRPLVAADRDQVRAILESTANFTAGEVATALELVDEWLEKGEASGYLIHVQERDEDAAGKRLTGYVCFGEVPLTTGTYDLYWIAVEPAMRGQGHGQALLKFAEAEVKSRGGRLLLIETSSQPAYAPTIAFYEKAGYRLAARIEEFYKPRDDKLVFAKRI